MITPFRLPFDWKNPYGFFIGVTMEFEVATYLLLLVACLLTLSCGCLLFMLTMIKVAKQSLHSINKTAKLKSKRTLISNQLTQFIQYHSILKQLSELLYFG